MIITPHKYPFAINDDGLPIHIDNISQENRKQTHYYCYGCGAELFPVLGEKREHHFRHEKDAICDPDKYLHEFAKATIKKRFDESKKFIVKYNATQVCNRYDNCEFSKYGWQECKHDVLYELDLKQYYDTCSLEKGYYADLPDGQKKYIADIILTNSQNPQQSSTTIEIWVTHECTEDKKQNGGRIIEIKITCEKDASREIVENEHDDLPIRFYNFKNTIEIEPLRKFKHIKLLPGITGKVVVTDETICNEGLNYDVKAENEIIISTTDIDVSKLESLYFAKCNENGMKIPYIRFCEYGSITQQKDKSENLHCQYLSYEGHCLCKYYKYSSQKAKRIIEQNDIPYWEQQKK